MYRCFIAISLIVLSSHRLLAADDAYVPPTSPRQLINFDSDWRFIREDVAGAEAIDFDDSKWSPVTTPHTYNDVDTFNKIISHGEGQKGLYTGIAWYRKHFKLPPDANGNKVILEFEGMRQAGDIYLNGKAIGLYENGVTSYGLDITDAVRPVGQENVLAVKVDNSAKYAERASGSSFEWESKDFNPDYGGIHKHVWLHIMGKVHQTLPVYYGLETSGVYVYASNFDIAGHSADINVESQVKNGGDQSPVTLSAVVVDADGKAVAKFDGDTVDMVGGEKTIAKASGKLTGIKWWSPDQPNLYSVYTILTVDNKVVDVVRTTTGFRKVDFRGGAGKGGVYINDQFTYLTGYAQRATNEWAGLGQAYPDWMHDLTAKLIHDSHANYVRWMHIAPQPVDVAAFDRFGIVEVCPAGDKEKDVTGRQWDQRVEVMRDTIISYRNSPSILFWEAGNNHVTAEHLKQMVDLKAELDPNGGRAMGCRTLEDRDTTPIAEYFGVMIGQDDNKDTKRKDPTDLFRAYSDERRDRSPIIEMEDFRDEAARRFWDDASPPHFGFKPGPDDTYHWNSETFCVAAAERYWAYWSNRISNSDSAHAKWSGYASIYFSDSNADGRQDSSEVCRVSGKVDAVRLPKEAWYAYRVMQNPQPDLHIIGHWTYPAGTKKTVYVISNCDSVRLSLNGKTLGDLPHPTQDGFVFAFTDVAYAAGTLTATGTKSGKTIEESLQTAGPAKSIKLTPITGPGGFHADGGDVALVDVEVVDAKGNRCPTDEARIDFDLTGPAIWRGGYNSGIVDSTNNKYLSTECGINRIAIRSTTTPGTITLKARRDGLGSATLELHSLPPQNERTATVQ